MIGWLKPQAFAAFISAVHHAVDLGHSAGTAEFLGDLFNADNFG